MLFNSPPNDGIEVAWNSAIQIPLSEDFRFTIHKQEQEAVQTPPGSGFRYQPFTLQQTVAILQLCSTLRVASFPAPLVTSFVSHAGQRWAE